MNKKNLKIAGATSMALFSLVSVFTAVIAWFVVRPIVDADGMTIVVSKETGRIGKIEIHKLLGTFTKTEIDEDENEIEVPYYSFERTASATIYGSGSVSTKDFPLGDFNPLSTDHPILILFTYKTETISVTAGDMFINGHTETTGFLGEVLNGAPRFNLGDSAPTLKRGTRDVPVDPDNPEGETKTVDCYPLSSAVNFKCTQYSVSEYNTLLSASQSGRIDMATTSIHLNESFVNFASTGSGITFEKDPTIYTSPGGNANIKHIAMVVNYDSDAISAIYSTYLGNTLLEGEYGGQLYFSCDWQLEVF